MVYPFTPHQLEEITAQTAAVNCIQCDSGDELTYVFNPQYAALHAVNLSYTRPIDLVDAGFLDPDLVHYSGMFMSLAYYAGGLPMIGARQSTTAQLYGRSDGWYAFCNSLSKLSASHIWGAHETADVLPSQYTAGLDDDNAPVNTVPWNEIKGQGLIHLISGAPGLQDVPTGAIIERTPRAPDIKGLVVPVRRVFDKTWVDGEPVYTPRAARFAPVAAAGISDFMAGDYVYIDNIGAVPHGFMIVGRGPAIDWIDFMDAYVQGKARIYSEEVVDAKGHRFRLWHDSSVEIADYTSNYGVTDVPYVVDWYLGKEDSRGLQSIRQQPRPFYANLVYAQGHRQSREHHYWLFVPALYSIKIACDFAYAVNCAQSPVSVESDGTIHACGKLS